MDKTQQVFPQEDLCRFISEIDEERLKSLCSQCDGSWRTNAMVIVVLKTFTSIYSDSGSFDILSLVACKIKVL